MTTLAENAIRETAWHFREDEFQVGEHTYAFVRPITGRKSDHLMVKYPQGGLSTCKERWNKDFEGRYKIGGEFLLKSEIISKFGLAHVQVESKPQTREIKVKASAFDKVTSVLRELHSGGGSDEFLATRKQIASAAGVSVVSVSNVLKKHNEAGTITTKGLLQGTLIRVQGVL